MYLIDILYHFSSLNRHEGFKKPPDNLVTLYLMLLVALHSSTSRQPRGLKRAFAAVRLLRWRVRIPLESWKSVSCGSCVLQVKFYSSGWSVIQRSPTECDDSECDREPSTRRKPGPIRCGWPMKNYRLFIIPTFIIVKFDTGTNFPTVNWKLLLAVAMMNIRHRWNGIGVPTQSHPNAASLTLSAWNISKLRFQFLLNRPVWFLGLAMNIFHH